MFFFQRRLCSTLVAFSNSNSATMPPSSSSRPTLRGVIFDMDGTLTVPNLDFPIMYQRCGVSRSEDILKAVQRMEPAKKQAALDIIEEMEEEGRQTLRLIPGAAELGRWLHSHQIPTALVTRNTYKTVQTFESKLWKIDAMTKLSPVISRDSHEDILPPKPHPASLHWIAKEWNLEADENLLMVGDSPAHDVVFGKAAGVSTALLDTRKRFNTECDGGADFKVSGLWQLPALLWSSFEIHSPLGTNVPLLKYSAPTTPQTQAAVAAINGHVDDLHGLSQQELLNVDDTGNTPLIWASDAGQTHVVEFLLSKIADDDHINTRGYLGATALCRASRRGYVEIVKLLLQQRESKAANPNIPNDKLQYPLHFAAFQKHAKVVELLLKHGANPLELDRKGRTPAQDTSDESIRNVLHKAIERATTIDL